MPAITDFAAQLKRTDPELYDLPHPKAARVIGIMAILSSMAGETGVEILSDLFKDRTRTKGRLVGEAALVFPSIRKLKDISEVNGKIDLAGLEGMLAPLRYFVNDGRIFEVDKRLDEMLAVTDIGSSAPIEYFRLPFPAVYFHFAAYGGGLDLHARTVGTSKLLGCYATELKVRSGNSSESTPFKQWAGPNDELTCYELTLVGRPIRTIADHGFSFVRVYVGPKMEGMTVEEVLRLNFEIWETRGTADVSDTQREQIIAGVTHLAKVLLQINVEGTQLNDEKEETAIAARLKVIGAKKQAKLERRLERTYDHILISHDFTRTTRSEPTGRKVSGHWRRGHYRHQPYGPGRALTKLKWIYPMWVGDAPAEGNKPVKDYAVRGTSGKA